MSIRIVTGDALTELAKLPAESVHCCVTSPPYFGLRDYGTASWDGGDPACDHTGVARRCDAVGRTDKQSTQKGSSSDRVSRTCLHCGATRIDAQLGLEPTPDDYVAAMVCVFREVKRVLRNDGVCFINIGDSYCSANTQPLYSVREDCSLRELQDVALAVLGLRITGDETAGARPLYEVLPACDQSRAVCERPGVARSGEPKELSPTTVKGDCGFDGTEPTDEDRCDRGIGREVRMLRGNDPAILDTGSHPRRRGGTQETADRQNQSVVDQDISRGQAARLSKGQIPSTLLELQLRDRIMGFLSARQFAGDEIPAAVRTCFKASTALKPKDLIGIPWLLAFALRADGWWLRQDIIWAKPNPMPESVTDRCTKAHEYVFMLSKSERYFYDGDAVREPYSEESLGRYEYQFQGSTSPGRRQPGNTDKRYKQHRDGTPNTAGRNKRSVWTIATAPYAEAHFATFPPALVEPCILAGTSARGVCPGCGAPWVRSIERIDGDHEADSRPKQTRGMKDSTSTLSLSGHHGKGWAERGTRWQTSGWYLSCNCRGKDLFPKPVPATVIDPFLGAGTTALVADRLGRSAIGIELNPTYAAMARRRVEDDAGMFAQIDEAAE